MKRDHIGLANVWPMLFDPPSPHGSPSFIARQGRWRRRGGANGVQGGERDNAGQAVAGEAAGFAAACVADGSPCRSAKSSAGGSGTYTIPGRSGSEGHCQPRPVIG